MVDKFILLFGNPAADHKVVSPAADHKDKVTPALDPQVTKHQ